MNADIENHMKDFLSPYLCGFSKGYSTQHCMLAMMEKMKKSLDKGHHAAAILTDLSKAFDSINNDLLIAKLAAYGFSHSSLKYMQSYLTNRKQRTKVNNSYSSWTSPENGFPQGSILGPTVFNVYINDMLLEVEGENLANYADDNTPRETGGCLECVMTELENNSNTLLLWFNEN